MTILSLLYFGKLQIIISKIIKIIKDVKTGIIGISSNNNNAAEVVVIIITVVTKAAVIRANSNTTIRQGYQSHRGGHDSRQGGSRGGYNNRDRGGRPGGQPRDRRDAA